METKKNGNIKSIEVNETHKNRYENVIEKNTKVDRMMCS